jgi:hypothetical protein
MINFFVFIDDFIYTLICILRTILLYEYKFPHSRVDVMKQKDSALNYWSREQAKNVVNCMC